MTQANAVITSVRRVEALMLKHFEQIPFHNLSLLYGRTFDSVPGGTCSDKTLIFIAEANSMGFDVSLHTGYIGGQEIHRLARVCINDLTFFADVGNGWPSLRMYPMERDIEFSCFGMRYRTRVRQNRVFVYHQKNGTEQLQLEIDARIRPEADIMVDINERFTSGIEYPFAHGLRYSQVVGDRFLFLRGECLEIHSDKGIEILKGVVLERVPKVLSEYFGCNWDFPSDLKPMVRTVSG